MFAQTSRKDPGSLNAGAYTVWNLFPVLQVLLRMLLCRKEAATRGQSIILQKVIQQWINEHWISISGQNHFWGVNMRILVISKTYLAFLKEVAMFKYPPNLHSLILH